MMVSVACNSNAPAEGETAKCEEGCEKECGNEGEKKACCEKDCEKECCADKGEACDGEGCEKECCKKKEEGATEAADSATTGENPEASTCDEGCEKECCKEA